METRLERIDDPELLKEKSLWQILRASRSIKDSNFNWFVGLVVLGLFTAYGFVEKDTSRVYTLLQKMAEIGINTSITILGFLVAGFTVFATVARPKLFVFMAERKNPKSGLSYLKHNFFTFMRAFIYWLLFAALECLIVLLGQKDSVLAAFISIWPDLEGCLYIGNRMMLAISATAFAFVFLQLKSFVYNVYFVVMVVIEFERE